MGGGISNGNEIKKSSNFWIWALIILVIFGAAILIIAGLSGCTTSAGTSKQMCSAPLQQQARPSNLYGYIELPDLQEYPIVTLTRAMYESLPRAGKDFKTEWLETSAPFGYKFICKGSPSGVIILGELVRGEDAIAVQYGAFKPYYFSIMGNAVPKKFVNRYRVVIVD